MLRKLWMKALHQDPDDQTGRARLPRPKPVMQPVGQSLVLNHGLDPDWVWSLMAVTRPSGRESGRSDFRVYSPQEASQRGVDVRDWHSLEDHPDLVHFQGWLDKNTREMEMNPGDAVLRRTA